MSGFLSGQKTETGLSLALISENKILAPDKPFTLGLFIEHEANFHTYWKNPGIVGIATTITWELPTGYLASEISWPYPETCNMAGHPCHGYERDILLTVTITPPKTKIQAKALTLKATVNWMCCASGCYPGKKEFTLKLPIAEQSTPDPTVSLLFKKGRQEFPKKSSNWKLSSSRKTSEGQLELLFQGPHQGDPPNYFFSGDGIISSDQKQDFVLIDKGLWRLIIRPSEYAPEDQRKPTGVLRTLSGFHEI